VVVIDVIRSELIQILKSINNFNCSQEDNRSQILRVKMFNVNFVTFAFSNYYSVMTALKMLPVLMLLN